jgi:Ser/Thr protein kinase RdoA (MazF antagonist)
MTPPEALPAADVDAPYARLTPDVVLDALDSAGLRGDGRLLQLNSYENRVFQVFLEDGRVVVAKFYRPARWSNAQILEEHAFAAQLAAAEIPVVAPWPLAIDAEPRLRARADGEPPTLLCIDGPAGAFRISISPRCAGHAPDLDHDDHLEWIGRFIGRMHAVGATRDFSTRRRFDIATFGEAPRDWLLAHDTLTPEVLPDWLATVNTALDEASRLFAEAGAVRSIRLHGDCHPGNILWRDEGELAGPHFVDLDDAVNGPAVQDLWMLLSGERTAMTRQLGAVLAGYESFMDFNPRELVLVEALRTLRMLHHSAWIAQRWNDPAFPPAFPWFGTSSYWAQQTTQLREQIAAMREPALSFYPA